MRSEYTCMTYAEYATWNEGYNHAMYMMWNAREAHDDASDFADWYVEHEERFALLVAWNYWWTEVSV